MFKHVSLWGYFTSSHDTKNVKIFENGLFEVIISAVASHQSGLVLIQIKIKKNPFLKGHIVIQRDMKVESHVTTKAETGLYISKP